ncbi:hypothetical protein [Methylobacterium isbiliense]|nr:hypothetical protein [Methylobacterium isbiliense]MDN3625867.1 hypothetical protein [Methylobacterium isbiliense]
MPDVNWCDPQWPREGAAQSTARVHPTPEEARPIDIKIVTRMITHNEESTLDGAVAAVMQSYQNADLCNIGTVVDTLERDWIYAIHEVADDARPLDQLKPLLEAKLGRSVTVESFRHLEAYPGPHWMYSYAPDAFVLNRR